MPSLIQNFLSGFIKEGALEVELPSGKLMRFGEPNVTAPSVALRDPKAQWTGRLHTGAFRNPAAYRTRRTHVLDIEVLRLHYARTLQTWAGFPIAPAERWGITTRVTPLLSAAAPPA
jgi:hypothetical protein